jgi:hypothetical protein
MSGGWWARVLGNRIHDSGKLGIGHGSSVNPNINDSGDVNSGPPGYYLNYPVIDIVEVIDGLTYVNGSLDTPNPEQCLVEIFATQCGGSERLRRRRTVGCALYPNADGTFR